LQGAKRQRTEEIKEEVHNQVGQTMHTMLAQVTKEVKDCKIEMYQAELECIKRQQKALDDQQKALDDQQKALDDQQKALDDQKTALDNREKFVKDKLNVLLPQA
jgi:hypothetical protein